MKSPTFISIINIGSNWFLLSCPTKTCSLQIWEKIEVRRERCVFDKLSFPQQESFFFFFLISFSSFPFFFFFSFLFLLFRSVVELALFPRGGQAKHKRILKKNKTFMTKKLYLMFFNGTKIIYNWFEMKFFSSVFILNSQLNNIYLKFHVLYCRNLGSHLKKKYLFFLRI